MGGTLLIVIHKLVVPLDENFVAVRSTTLTSLLYYCITVLLHKTYSITKRNRSLPGRISIYNVARSEKCMAGMNLF